MASLAMKRGRMYSVKKEDGKTFVYDWQGKVVWSASDDDYILYTPNAGLQKGSPTAAKVGGLTDPQILTALASAIKLSL